MGTNWRYVFYFLLLLIFPLEWEESKSHSSVILESALSSEHVSRSSKHIISRCKTELEEEKGQNTRKRSMDIPRPCSEENALNLLGAEVF